MLIKNIKKQIENEKRYFKYDVDGKILFSPWGKNSINYIVTEQKKNDLLNFLSLFYFSGLAFFSIVIGGRYLGYFSSDTLVIFNTLGWFVFPFWYYLELKKATSDHEILRSKSKKIPSIIYFLICCLFINLLTVSIGFFVFNQAPIFVGVIILIHISYIFIILWLIKINFKLNKLC